ncbi:PREDICTED: serine carboxypeptidase-like 13 isoform X2 [Ipomoea nil]|uniref:serine carboxypeptidase-like 13 isoform X2 n=1 Tax=Ipomoea nil TaxID=35883 RepID=UPI000901AAD6|nr:PREDICTED: serine carboxypeptidase-like 13 isoform X2 [Ipomoea nil]
MDLRRMFIVPTWSCLHFLFFFFCNNLVVSFKIVDTLPGYSGTLPFKLQTGYIGVGEYEDVQLFYYFVESEKNAEKDPLVLWLTGGPGCSGLSGLTYEIGPFTFDLPSFDGTLPSINLNPYSWTKIASIIFIDSPVGTGFSYAKSPKNYPSTDTTWTNHLYMFLQKWLSDHPQFQKNRLYIAGDSYAGKIVPMVVSEIKKGIENGSEPRMLIQGYIIGNPCTNSNHDTNWRIPYAHKLAIISDEYYKFAESSCNGEYVNPDPSNFKCLYALQPIQQCIEGIFLGNVLEPTCKFSAPNPTTSMTQIDIDIFLRSEEEPWCRNHNYIPSYFWANDPSVQEALGIEKGSISDWKRCNKSLAFESDVPSALEYHQLFSNSTPFQVLVYSGDHDMNIPYLGTLSWIHSLNLTVDCNWKPWFVNGQIAGYYERYKRSGNEFYLTFATVKGAGHTAPEYKPKECLALLDRWLSSFPL